MKHARLVIATCALAFSLHSALAQEKLSPPHISVSGSAMLSVAPDIARLRAGVTATGTTAKAAGEASAQAMSSVMTAIKAAGIAEKDVQTSRYSIQPIFSDTNPRKITGFTASNDVTLTVRNLDSLGALIDKLTAAGANAMGGIQFVVSDANKLLDKVRADALGD
ncbi:MAG: SIMPL domain-containing protein, partial [Rhizomicrobium sp.]